MYEAFYGFHEKPFNLTPDPRFLFLSAKHSEAFAHLEFGLKQRGGFVVVTGDVGTGKTTLCRSFLDRLDENTISAFILYPALNAVELLQSIADDLGVESTATTAKELVDALHQFLLDSRAAGKNIVLVIDEAQNLAPDVLEQIRLISNLETTTEKLIQIVLIGQSELTVLLEQTALRQLAQRVTARYHLKPLNREETIHYIRHRLGVAGGVGKVSFTSGALGAIHRFSGGIPRLTNLICDRALLAGFVLGKREIDRPLIRRAIKELNAVGSSRRWYQSWRVRGALAAVVLAAVTLSFRSEAQRLLAWPGGQWLFGRERAEPVEAATLESDTVVPAPQATWEEFGVRLLTLSGELSRRGATSVVFRLWGVDIGGGPGVFSSSEDLTALARRQGLELTALTAHFEQLRLLNQPVVLELFHSSRKESCFAALTRLEGDTAVVSFAPGDRVRVPLSVLERFWMRRALVVWKDFEGLTGMESNPRRVQAWLLECLRGLGFLSEGVEKS
ncbi:MAG: ExeA family protein, partial [Acidobacteriota bacterium]